jgi:hypothetical protein
MKRRLEGYLEASSTLKESPRHAMEYTESNGMWRGLHSGDFGGYLRRFRESCRARCRRQSSLSLPATRAHQHETVVSARGMSGVVSFSTKRVEQANAQRAETCQS